MRSYGVEDVLVGHPDWPTLLKRGLRRRCPRCGGSSMFRSRFRLRERCPDCGYKFIREPGFRLGAWFLNFMFIGVLHWAGVMAWIVWRSNNGGTLLWPMLVAAVTGISVPILTYPWSLSIWSAVDLGMTPLELDEIVDARESLDDGGPEPVEHRESEPASEPETDET